MFGNEPLRPDSRLIAKALAVLRIVTALLFLQHGMTKILSYPLSSASGPREWTLLWLAGLLELFGSLLLLVGLFTRPVAFLLAGEMAIAYWMVHAPRGPFPMLNDGEGAILFCFIFLLFVATGPGTWSADEQLLNRRDREAQ
ncbi:MAG: DoxX family protein [Sphingomonas bacterium]|nr:DoxX family protein [Sphingomonas bacterium]